MDFSHRMRELQLFIISSQVSKLKFNLHRFSGFLKRILFFILIVALFVILVCFDTYFALPLNVSFSLTFLMGDCPEIVIAEIFKILFFKFQIFSIFFSNQKEI